MKEAVMPSVLTTFYTAFSPSCFALLGLWLVIIGINADAWLNSGYLRQKQVYAVAQGQVRSLGMAATAAFTAMAALAEF